MKYISFIKFGSFYFQVKQNIMKDGILFTWYGYYVNKDYILWS